MCYHHVFIAAEELKEIIDSLLDLDIKLGDVTLGERCRSHLKNSCQLDTRFSPRWHKTLAELFLERMPPFICVLF